MIPAMHTSHAQLAEHCIRVIQYAADPTRATERFCSGIPNEHVSVRVLSIGKAAATMYSAAAERLGHRLTAGMVVAPEATLTKDDRVPRTTRLASDHPFPTERSLLAAECVLRFIREGNEPIVVLLSGGGSAMVSLPVEGLMLEDLKTVSSSLMRSGATIHELNAVRKHLDQTKGGRLGLAGSHRQIRVGVISDVIGDRIDVISSGPFAPDPTTFQDAEAVLRKHGISIPSIDKVLAKGTAGNISETPKPGDSRLEFITHTVLASNSTVLESVRKSLHCLGIAGIQLFGCQAGSASQWATLVSESLGTGAGAILIGGESTVSGVPESGKGGPVQAVVLEAAIRLEKCSEPWMVLGYATDGIDGPTDAAGAALDHTFTPRLHNASKMLELHRSYDALNTAGALIRTGPSGTNLNDIVIGLRGPIVFTGDIA